MVVTEQIDALRALAIDPIAFLIVPRFIGIVVTLFVMTLYADALALFGAAYTRLRRSSRSSRASFYNGLTGGLLDFGDVANGLVKSVVFGLVIALVELPLRPVDQGRRPGRRPQRQRHGRRQRRRASSSSTTSSASSSDERAVTAEEGHRRTRWAPSAGAARRRARPRAPPAIDLFVGGRELYSVFVRTLYYVARGKRDKGAVVRQMYEIGNKSLFFVSITMGFIGMILRLPGGPPGQARPARLLACSARRTSSFSCATSPRRSARSCWRRASARASPPRSARWSSPSRSTRCACARPTPSTSSSCRASSRAWS